MYGAALAYHSLSVLWRLYSKIFTMTLAFGHPLREGHEVFQDRKLSIGIMMAPPPSPHRRSSVTRARGAARQFDHQRLQMLDLAQRERACLSHREGRTGGGLGCAQIYNGALRSRTRKAAFDSLSRHRPVSRRS